MTIKNTNQYPPDVLAGNSGLDTINSREAQTLDQLFRERVRRSSNKPAYSQFDPDHEQWIDITWAELALQVERWQVAFRDSGLIKGDRVAICYKNSIEWVIFDQAALRLGLVVVPLYTADRADNISYVIGHSGARLVMFNSPETWLKVLDTDENVSCVETVLIMQGDEQGPVKKIENWLPDHGQHLERGMAEPDDLASIVYTSGTTGRPKGVMLSHRNMLSNAYSGLRSVLLTPQDKLLSFLPLSHTLERTVGYYAAMMSGSSVAFNRSIPELSTDLKEVCPTVMISVPRVFEQIHNQVYASLKSMKPIKRQLFHRAIKTGWHHFQYQQGLAAWHPRLIFTGLLDKLVGQTVRERFGGRLKFVVVGGAPLMQDVAKTFISLGIPLLQGYGLTEYSPVVSVNTDKRNRPDSIGLPLRGVQITLQEKDELWVKGDSVMQGYWQDSQATSDVIVEYPEGEMQGRWLRTGDRASVDDQGFIRIIGRIKDILVLANGEKVPPSDIEAAILSDLLFEQAMVFGEGRPFVGALLVINSEQWALFCAENSFSVDEINSKKVNAVLTKRIALQMKNFPGYARIRQVYVTTEPWTIESGLLTPTLKVKRSKVMAAFEEEIKSLYARYGVLET